MKYLILSILMLSFQCSFTQKWDCTYGSSNTNDYFHDVIECYDGGYLISGANDIFPYPNILLKTDINGVVLWEKSIQHDELSITNGAVSQNSSGEFAIARCLNYSNGDQWPTVTKLDSCGNKIWCREYIDDEYSHGWFDDVILYDNGDVLALGYLFSTENYNERIFLYYIDQGGTLKWRQSYASKENHPLILERMGRKLHQNGNDYIIVGECYYPYPGNPATGYLRPFFIGIDSLYNEKWILPFGVNDSILGVAYNVIPYSDSVYLGVGSRWESGNQLNSILMFFNDSGEELGYNQVYNDAIGSDINDNITVDIARLNDSLLVTSTTFGSEPSTGAYGELIIDTAANIFKIEQRPKTKGISSLIKTFDGKFVIGCNYKHSSSNYDIYLYKINDSLQFDTIYPGTYTYDSLCPYQIESGIIDISNCLIITDVSETPTPEEYFVGLNTIHIKALPNPTNTGSIKLQYSNTEQHSEMELRCFNIHGEEVHSERIYQDQGESLIDVDSWPDGMYLAIVYSDNKPVGRVKFVVK